MISPLLSPPTFQMWHLAGRVLASASRTPWASEGFLLLCPQTTVALFVVHVSWAYSEFSYCDCINSLYVSALNLGRSWELPWYSFSSLCTIFNVDRNHSGIHRVSKYRRAQSCIFLLFRIWSSLVSPRASARFSKSVLPTAGL